MTLPGVNDRTIRDDETGEQITGEEFMRRARERNAKTNDANRRAAVYLVEADDFAQLRLWIENAEEGDRQGWKSPFKKVRWEQVGLGYGHEIGKFGGMPVCVCVSFARIKGHLVAFYEATSQVVDHRMVEEWLKTEFPSSRGKTNAQNFHNCLLDLDRVPK